MITETTTHALRMVGAHVKYWRHVASKMALVLAAAIPIAFIIIRHKHTPRNADAVDSDYPKALTPTMTWTVTPTVTPTGSMTPTPTPPQTMNPEPMTILLFGDGHRSVW